MIGDILLKIASGEKLSEIEKTNLRLYGNLTELNNEFIKGMQNGASNINVNNISARTGDFFISPLGGVHLQLGPDQTIATSTWTKVNLEKGTTFEQTNKFFEFDNSNNRLYFKSAWRRFAFLGRVFWKGNTTGARVIRRVIYNTDGSQFQYSKLSGMQSPTSDVGELAQSFNFTLGFFAENGFTPGMYMTIEAWQNTGGNLDITGFNLSVFAIG